MCYWSVRDTSEDRLLRDWVIFAQKSVQLATFIALFFQEKKGNKMLQLRYCEMLTQSNSDWEGNPFKVGLKRDDFAMLR